MNIDGVAIIRIISHSNFGAVLKFMCYNHDFDCYCTFISWIWTTSLIFTPHSCVSLSCKMDNYPINYLPLYCLSSTWAIFNNTHPEVIYSRKMKHQDATIRQSNRTLYMGLESTERWRERKKIQALSPGVPVVEVYPYIIHPVISAICFII